MISSGKDIEVIIEKLSILQYEIERNGKAGLTNLHKHAENLFRDLLSLTYHQDLQNLNNTISNYPGIDVGSEKDGIAYQISSRNDAGKINDTLDKFLNNKLQARYPKLRFMLLSDKKVVYKIRSLSDPSLKFDPAEDILDIDDLQKAIGNLPAIQIRIIRELLERELPYLSSTRGEKGTDVACLIDIAEDMVACKLDTFVHWSANIKFNDVNLSTPQLYRMVKEYFNSTHKLQFLHILYSTFQKRGGDTNEVRYEEGLRDENDSSYYKHKILAISKNNLRMEFAHYRRKEDINSDLNEEVGGLLSMLIAAHSFYKGKRMDTEVTINYRSNGKVYFVNQHSVFSVQTNFSSFFLHPPLNIKEEIYNVENDTLTDLMQLVIYGFVAEPSVFNANDPFLHIDRREQSVALETLKNIIGPTFDEVMS